MKKVFVIRHFAERTPSADNELLVAFRRKDKLFIGNLAYPEDRMTITHDARNEKVLIEITLRETEYLAIGDGDGIEAKKIIEGQL